jgi:hypothetical protein
VANLPAPAVPPGFLPRLATIAALPPVTIDPPPRTWSATAVTYVRREVEAETAGTRGAPEAALSREVGAGVAGTCGAPGATLSQEVAPPDPLRARRWALEPWGHVAPPELPCAGAAATRCSPEAALSREVGAGAGATGTRGDLGALPRVVRAWWYLSRPQIIHIG